MDLTHGNYNFLIPNNSISPESIYSTNPPIGYDPGTKCNNSNFDYKNIELDLSMVNNLKDKFILTEFESKYQGILAKSTDPIIKSETIKLSTAAIINTLKIYFNTLDPEDETNMNLFLTELVTDNQELKYCIEKLSEYKNKKDNINVIEECKNDPDIEIEIIEDDKAELDESLTKSFIEKKEAEAYYKTKIELEKLINKRRNEIAGIFNMPNQNDINKFFGNKISIKDDKDKKDENNASIYEWNDAVDLFKKYDISPNVITLLTALNDFKKELNETHAKFISTQNAVNKFNNIIISQLNWLSNIPDCFDGSVIVENIESIIEKYFDKQDIANLFKDYKKTYNKMMMLITFIPREFMAKNACAICLSNTIDTIFVPCGHSCCSGCGSTLTSCMVCRTKIDKKQKIYDI
jgi:hypothetical protein